MLDGLVDDFLDFGTAWGNLSRSRPCSKRLPRGSEEFPRCALTPSRERAAQRRSSLSLQPTFKTFKRNVQKSSHHTWIKGSRTSMRRGYLKYVPSALFFLNALPVLMLAPGFGGVLETSWGRLGASRRCLWGVLGRLWGALGVSWDVLKRSKTH